MAAAFYPDADSLKVIAYDDELDQGSLLNDYSGSTKYVDNMIAYVEACLGRSSPASLPAPDFGWSTIYCFYSTGKKVNECSSKVNVCLPRLYGTISKGACK
ncbi:uncharacterized protein N7484_003508 [Penicillium longicatenatum]|uniref:uncharacterized protein n=1 Tax=Penicillium longicatenatum TaxID=1561947 RepID=UPI002548B13C|nr:uncharacterized protein N7484_003508 [Penicillium longicatenatum]KAJ5649785.1 hypothetical protein N7484_003508 [Penicillium longicatenatum]